MIEKPDLVAVFRQSYETALDVRENHEAAIRAGVGGVQNAMTKYLEAAGRLIPEIPADVMLISMDDRASISEGRPREWDLHVAWRDGMGGRRVRITAPTIGEAMRKAIAKGEARTYREPPRKEL